MRAEGFMHSGKARGTSRVVRACAAEFAKDRLRPRRPVVLVDVLRRSHHDPDRRRYPLFCNAQAQRIVLHAGVALFLPCGRWHIARSLNTTTSIAFDQLGPDNWRDFAADAAAARRRAGKPAAARLLGAWLAAVGPGLAVSERSSARRSMQWGK